MRFTRRLRTIRARANGAADDEAGVADEVESEAMSKRSLVKFALPALGISLAGPILSNIDNAFVGRLSGRTALAALSPGTTVADNILYLLVFLPRATVGLVSR